MDQTIAIRLPEVSGRWAGATAAEQAQLIEAAHTEALAEDAARVTATEQQESWLFTFGARQAHDGHFVVIAGTYGAAREEMLARFGQAWAFQYPASDRDRLERQYGMAELTPALVAMEQARVAYKQAEEAHALARVSGDMAKTDRTYRAMRRRAEELDRATLAAADAQAVTR